MRDVKIRIERPAEAVKTCAYCGDGVRLAEAYRVTVETWELPEAAERPHHFTTGGKHIWSKSASVRNDLSGNWNSTPRPMAYVTEYVAYACSQEHGQAAAADKQNHIEREGE